MRALENLSARIETKPQWLQTYEANRAQAQAIAARMPLIHEVSGETLEARIRAASEWLPTSAAPDYASPLTRESEDRLGFRRSLYFYAGRACGFYGQVLLAFGPDCEAAHSGAAAWFDTGGFLRGYIPSNLPDPDEAARTAFIRESCADLSAWRDSFATYLAAYFQQPQDYWQGAPWQPDPDGILTHPDEKDWRAWTYEVRFYEGQSFLEAAAWCATPEAKPRLEAALQEFVRFDPSAEPRIATFLARSLSPNGSLRLKEEMEDWVRGSVGLT